MNCMRLQVFHRICGHYAVCIKHSDACRAAKKQSNDSEHPSPWYNHATTENLPIPDDQIQDYHLCSSPDSIKTHMEFFNSKCYGCNTTRHPDDPARLVETELYPIYVNFKTKFSREEVDRRAEHARKEIEAYEAIVLPLLGAADAVVRKQREEAWDAKYVRYLASEEGQGPDVRLVCDLQNNGTGFLADAEPPFDDVCLICQFPLVTRPYTDGGEGNARKIPCGHVLHYQCIVEWALYRGYGSCPYCRHQWKLIFKNGFAPPDVRWYPAQRKAVQVAGYIPFVLDKVRRGNLNPFIGQNRFGEENVEEDYA